MSKKKIMPNYGKQKMSPSMLKTRVMTEAEIRKIKEEATQEAISIIESKYDSEALKNEGYNEAIGIAHKYFILCGAKALHEVFKFGPKRLERFVEAMASQDANMEVLEKWFTDYTGMQIIEDTKALLRIKEDEDNGIG